MTGELKMEDKLGAIFNIFHNLSTSQTLTQKQLDTVIFFPCQTPAPQEDHPHGVHEPVSDVVRSVEIPRPLIPLDNRLGEDFHTRRQTTGLFRDDDLLSITPGQRE